MQAGPEMCCHWVGLSVAGCLPVGAGRGSVHCRQPAQLNATQNSASTLIWHSSTKPMSQHVQCKSSIHTMYIYSLKKMRQRQHTTVHSKQILTADIQVQVWIPDVWNQSHVPAVIDQPTLLSHATVTCSTMQKSPDTPSVYGMPVITSVAWSSCDAHYALQSDAWT